MGIRGRVGPGRDAGVGGKSLANLVAPFVVRRAGKQAAGLKNRATLALAATSLALLAGCVPNNGPLTSKVVDAAAAKTTTIAQTSVVFDVVTYADGSVSTSVGFNNDAAMGATVVIPSNRTRRVIIPHDAVAYKHRNRIERCFNRLKHFRRFATRYDRRTLHFTGFALLAAAMIWLR